MLLLCEKEALWWMRDHGWYNTSVPSELYRLYVIDGGSITLSREGDSVGKFEPSLAICFVISANRKLLSHHIYGMCVIAFDF
jgi:hypothetical protein